MRIQLLAAASAMIMVMSGCQDPQKSSTTPARRTPAAEAPAADTTPTSKVLTVLLPGGVNMDFVPIPAGTYKMGTLDPYGEGEDDEIPQHEVTLTNPFYMSKTEVTQAQWQAVMGNNPSRFQGADRPVERVTWEDCQAFCVAAQKATDRAIRLPSEAQWEYACRAGSDDDYSFGNDVEQLDLYAWYGSNSDQKPHPVGTKEPNKWGLHDMHGNVWEWCADWYDPDFYSYSPPEDPRGAENGATRVLRGGSVLFKPWPLRSAYRGKSKPTSQSDHVGFRVVINTVLEKDG